MNKKCFQVGAALRGGWHLVVRFSDVCKTASCITSKKDSDKRSSSFDRQLNELQHIKNGVLKNVVPVLTEYRMYQKFRPPAGKNRKFQRPDFYITPRSGHSKANLVRYVSVPLIVFTVHAVK